MPSVRKTYKYKLVPTADQQRQMACTLGLCNWLYNTALEQRRIAWKFHRVRVTKGQQETELPFHQGRLSRVCRGPLPGVAGRPGASGQSLSSLLSAGAVRGESRFSSLPGSHPLSLLHLQA